MDNDLGAGFVLWNIWTLSGLYFMEGGKYFITWLEKDN